MLGLRRLLRVRREELGQLDTDDDRAPPLFTRVSDGRAGHQIRVVVEGDPGGAGESLTRLLVEQVSTQPFRRQTERRLADGGVLGVGEQREIRLKGSHELLRKPSPALLDRARSRWRTERHGGDADVQGFLRLAAEALDQRRVGSHGADRRLEEMADVLLHPDEATKVRFEIITSVQRLLELPVGDIQGGPQKQEQQQSKEEEDPVSDRPELG